MAAGKDRGSLSNMDVDYVLKFSFKDIDEAAASVSFQQLIQTLASVGLATEVRAGGQDSLLIFTKVSSDEHLFAEVYRSRTRDWLHGIRSAQPDKDHATDQPLYPAERLRIVHSLITSPPNEGGAGITPSHGEWKQVLSIFPLHDRSFNKKWLKKWATSYTLKVEDLDEIRDMFGAKVAFYFAFTQSYFTALIGIAILGASAWIVLGNFSPVYGIVNGLLCVIFVEYWKHQEYDLAVRWGVHGVSRIDSPRAAFIPTKIITDAVTGEMTPYFSGLKRLQRQFLMVPFAFFAAIALGALIATCFGIEIFISEVYNGPLKSVLVFLPTGIITTMQPLVLGFLQGLATSLCQFENHETESAYESALTQKIFILNFITSYLPIFLTAFVYVPFGSVIVPYLDVFSLTVKPFAESDAQLKAPKVGFQINPNRLKQQVIYFTVTAQIVNQTMEIALPFLKRRGLTKLKEMQNRRAASHGGAVPDIAENDNPEETSFLKRAREEADLAVYDVTSDFREMVVQYGYLSLFSVVWPLTPVSFLVNNWFELRTDAAKICMESQRPTPVRAESIGPWLDSLGLLTWLGSITTAALMYLFSNGGMGPGGSPSQISLWALLVAIFFSEHSYLLVRLAVQISISKLDSPGRRQQRAEKYMIRKKFLEKSVGEQAAKVATSVKNQQITRETLEQHARDNSLHAVTDETRFWSRQQGPEDTMQIGSKLMNSLTATQNESKKAR